MTTYRNINDTEVAVDAPLTQQLMQSLKDNVLAIQEGDSTAVTAGKTIALAALASFAATPAAGDNVIAMSSGHSTDGVDITSGFKIRVAGTYRLRLVGDHRGLLGSSNSATYKIEKSTNSGGAYSDLQTTTKTSDESFTLTDDEACNAGDFIRFSIPSNTNSEASFFATISVSDDNAIYGVQVIPLATLQTVG